jgi:Ig-like domain from next to BRCA1 gene
MDIRAARQLLETLAPDVLESAKTGIHTDADSGILLHSTTQANRNNGDRDKAKAVNWNNSLCVLFCLLLTLGGCSAREVDKSAHLTSKLSNSKAINLTQDTEGYATDPSTSVNGDTWWVTWLEWDAESGSDSIQAVRLTAGNEDKRLQVDIPGGEYMSPRVLALADGSAWFFWVAVQESGSRILARYWRSGDWASPPIELGVAGVNGGFPVTALGKQDKPCIIWESAASWGREISAACWTGTQFQLLDSPSTPGESSYEPSIVGTTEGDIWVAWQARRNSSYEILMRRLQDNKWDEQIQVTSATDVASGRYLGMHVLPALAAGDDNRVWVSWISKELHTRIGNGWVNNRQIQFRAIEPSGKMSPIQQIPMNTENRHTEVSEEDAGPDVVSMVASNDKLYFFYRKLVSERFNWDLQLQVSPANSGQWLEKPVGLSYSHRDGRKSGYPAPAATQALANGALAAWQADNRTEVFDPANGHRPQSDIYLQVVQSDELSNFPSPGEAPTLYTSPLAYDKQRPTSAMPHLGQPLTLLQGDLHAHSVGSHDGQGGNDLFRENIRRAHDNGKIHFYAMTDHGMHATPADWHAQQKKRSIYDHIGDMQLLLGFEYTNDTRDDQGRVYGHQNVIFKKQRSELRSHISYPSPLDLWDSLSPGDSITIPHHTGNDEHPYTLDYFDERFVRVFEIFQERGSFECWCCDEVRGDGKSCDTPGNANLSPADGGSYFQQALARGQQLGVIASPDHHGFKGLGGIYTSSVSREGIFKALHARHSFGVSSYAARLTVDLRADGHLMGEEYSLSEEDCPVFYLQAATDHVDEVTGRKTVIKELKLYRVMDTAPGEDGHIFTTIPSASEYGTTFYDADCPREGTAAYYLRAKQSWIKELRNSMAWTSPVFVSWSRDVKARNASSTSNTLPTTVPPGEKFTASVDLENTGGIAWTGLEKYSLRLLDNAAATFSSPELIGLNPEEFTLANTSLERTLELTAPTTPGEYVLRWQMTSPAGNFGDIGSMSITVTED